MPKKYISSHGQTTESHMTVFPTSQFFASSNTTVKNINIQLLGKHNFNLLYHYETEKHSSHITTITSFAMLISKAKLKTLFQF